LKMNFLILVLLFCQAFFCSTNAASHNKILVQEDRTIILNKVIENGKSSNVETDRHMHLDWDRFRQLKSEYDSKFDELICTDPDQLRDMHRELDELSKKVELGWNLKQEQLDDLVDVLHNENYNATGLSTGNEGVDDLCQGLQEYIDKVNHTAWEVEKPELDDHLQEVIDIKIAIDTHPCPCVWGEWSIWSDCSTTCEAGERSRERVILKVAINNGTECEGDHDESEVCNADVCCPVNCVWNLWEEWNACPSGCDQHTTRTRTKAVVAVCNGTDCIGEDFEQKSCFRERELEDKIAVLKQQIDQCQDNTSEDCLHQPAEIALVVDRSGSMTSAWSEVKTWLEALVDAYEIDGITRKGGLVAWSSSVLESATVLFTENKSAAELKTAIENLPSPAGGTKAGLALNYTYSNLFEVGSDPMVFREIIFISDGVSESSSPMPVYPTVFHDNNIRMTAVALGSFNTAPINATLCIPCGDRFFINDDIDKLTSDEFLAELINCD